MRYSKIRDSFEQLDVAVISRNYPRSSINSVLNAHSKNSMRKRDLPNDLLVYYIICLGLYMHANLQEVLNYLLEGFRYISGFKFPKIVGKSGISQARSRLGYKVIQELFDIHVKPIATTLTKGAWYNGYRLVAIDGSVLDLPDEDKVRNYFGGSKNGCFPQARIVTLFECGTHVMFAGRIAPYNVSEKRLAEDVMVRLEPSMLCMADRGFHSFDLIKLIKKQGADFLLRVLDNTKLDVAKLLPDGSYICDFAPRRKQKNHREAIKIRVVEYTISGENDNKPYRLITTLMDHEKMPAKEIASLYHERWEAENILDEFKTHLRGGCRVRLRSKTPELIKQEFYGMMMAHFAIRGIMHEAALASNEDPDTLSFTHTVHILRRKIPVFAAFSPE